MGQLLVLADLDDTLTDRAGVFKVWAADFLQRLGRATDEIPELVRLDERGNCDRERFFDCVSQFLSVPLDVERELANYREATERPNVSPGVLDCINEIRAGGGQVVVLSNGIGPVQRRKLSTSGLDSLVDGIYVSGEVGFAKPDPRIFKMVVSTSAPDVDAWMVGDNFEKDILGAQAAGLRTAWVSHGCTAPAKSIAPDIVGETSAECFTAVIAAHSAGR